MVVVVAAVLQEIIRGLCGGGGGGVVDSLKRDYHTILTHSLLTFQDVYM